MFVPLYANLIYGDSVVYQNFCKFNYEAWNIEHCWKSGQKYCWYSAGDFIIASFTHGHGQCSICLAGFDGNCLNKGHLEIAIISQTILIFITLTGYYSKYRGSVHIIISFTWNRNWLSFINPMIKVFIICNSLTDIFLPFQQTSSWLLLSLTAFTNQTFASIYWKIYSVKW